MKAVNRRVMAELKREMKEWRKNFFEEMEEEMKKKRESAMIKLGDEIEEKVLNIKEDIVNEVCEKIKNENIIENEEDNELRKKVKDLEWKAEMNERKERRNNVLITGIKFNNEKVKDEVEKWLKDQLKIDVKIKEAWKTADEMTVVKYGEYEEKKRTMDERKKLKGTTIFISDDYTVREREIQKELRKRGAKAKEEGNKVLVKYKRIIINGVEWIWNEKKNGLFRVFEKEKGE